jgi:hypothetical protein
MSLTKITGWLSSAQQSRGHFSGLSIHPSVRPSDQSLTNSLLLLFRCRRMQLREPENSRVSARTSIGEKGLVVPYPYACVYMPLRVATGLLYQLGLIEMTGPFAFHVLPLATRHQYRVPSTSSSPLVTLRCSERQT